MNLLTIQMNTDKPVIWGVMCREIRQNDENN